MDDPAYPFLAFSGIPSVSFRFISKNVSVEAKQPGNEWKKLSAAS